MKYSLLLLVPLLLCACQKDDAGTPTTPQAMYDMAQQLLKPNVENAESDFAGALQWLRKAAEGGLLRAQLDLGGIYYAGGHGLEADARQAYDWFQKAAAQGSKEAEVFLGMLQYEGRLGEKNVQEAMKHWRLAADAGIAEGQYRLGRLLAQADETRQEGVDWLVKASASVPQAATALGNLYYKYLEDATTSAAWYEKGALAGDALAQHIFAEMLLLGEPVEKDTERGMAMLRMAAGQDYKPAMARLINILRNGKAAEENESEAAAWDARLQELISKEDTPSGK
ncbi:MAG: sel1 repeat family protein [Akkermansia sp.]|nr:sel1 repeat family protein [Akkermansia sp.]